MAGFRGPGPAPACSLSASVPQGHVGVQSLIQQTFTQHLFCAQGRLPPTASRLIMENEGWQRGARCWGSRMPRAGGAQWCPGHWGRPFASAYTESAPRTAGGTAWYLQGSQSSQAALISKGMQAWGFCEPPGALCQTSAHLSPLPSRPGAFAHFPPYQLRAARPIPLFSSATER